MEKIKHAAVKARNLMIRDFSQNFAACPVYFFVDTNLHYVLEGNFEKSLLSADLRPAKNIVFNQSDSLLYYIVYYGNPLLEKEHTRDERNSKFFGQGLVVLDYQYRELPRPFFVAPHWILVDNCQSRDYNIEYRCYADVLSKLLK